MNNPLAHLVPTDTPENIYYADLFQINGRNWMIQGYGKTDAARIASNKDSKLMYATDAVALIRNGNTLWGRYDPGALNNNHQDLHKLHKIDAIAYCLNPENTKKAYAHRGGKLEIVNVGYQFLSSLCATYPYPAYCASNFFSPDECEHLSDPLRMTQQFIALAKGTIDTKFLLIPYMPTVEGKAALYQNFVF